MEKFIRGYSSTEENRQYQKRKNTLDNAEDRGGKLEQNIINRSQRKKLMKNIEKNLGDKSDMGTKRLTCSKRSLRKKDKEQNRSNI